MSRISAAETGCWIDGHWGQYGTARLVDIAQSYGYQDGEDCAIAGRILASMGPAPDITQPGDWDCITDAADRAEEYLNSLAPDGYCFSWEDGEFFLMA
ncbi:MAG: hypothetical protein KGR26_13835, partial [Cyanobacteria bacterium REEB65]|nr:hypothetical protein [Cyanobacteria bacterium REEB65]